MSWSHCWLLTPLFFSIRFCVFGKVWCQRESSREKIKNFYFEAINFLTSSNLSWKRFLLFYCFVYFVVVQETKSRRFRGISGQTVLNLTQLIAGYPRWVPSLVGGTRCGGLTVSALVSGSSIPGSSLGGDIVLRSWAGHFTLTVPLSTQM